jgi:CCR4-NOT transcription complex subunit 7/8
MTPCILSVWSDNLVEAFDKIQEIIDNYPYIAMDTEFPGVVARPCGACRDPCDYNYQRVKCNVDLLKVIQIGLTFSNAAGEFPKQGANTFQFNFHFDLSSDLFASDSIAFLQQNGVDFAQHQSKGIDVSLFAEMLMSSGVVLNDQVKWLAFQGKYDFAYLVKLLSCELLPSRHEQFNDLLITYFPCLYDIKWLLHAIESQNILPVSDEEGDILEKGVKDRGLEDLATRLNVERIGQAHQAGSDSLLTSKVFFELVKKFLPELLETDKFEGRAKELANILLGLGVGFLRVEKDTLRNSANTTSSSTSTADSCSTTALNSIERQQQPPFPPLSGAIRITRTAVQE